MVSKILLNDGTSYISLNDDVSDILLNIEDTPLTFVDVDGVAVRGYNFSMYSGDSKYITVSVADSDGTATDFTNAAIRWEAVRSLRSTVSAIACTCSSGIAISATAGLFQIILEPDDTADLNGTYYHECQVIFPSGTIATLFRGEMTVEPDLV